MLFNANGEVDKPINLRILLGAYNITEQDGEWFKVRKVIIHPNYSPIAEQNDIALIELKTRINFTEKIAPVCLANDSVTMLYLPGMKAVATGWGFTSPQGPISDVLRQVKLPIVTQRKCRKVYGKDMVTKLNICAGYEKGGKDLCSRDGGGPLSIKFERGLTQVGIASRSTCGSPGIYIYIIRYLNVLKFIFC